MTLFNTMDGCFERRLRLGVRLPVRKVFYNLVVTGPWATPGIADRGSDLSGTDVRTFVSDRPAAVQVC